MKKEVIATIGRILGAFFVIYIIITLFEPRWHIKRVNHASLLPTNSASWGDGSLRDIEEQMKRRNDIEKDKLRELRRIADALERMRK